MKRSQSADDGSLELLLDTICNTFGGIIFISLLLFILINTTSESAQSGDAAQQVTASQLVNAETRRAQRASQLERLRHSETAQQSVTGVLASKELVQRAERLKDAEARHARQVQTKSEAVGEASRAQIDINKLQQDLEAKRKKLEEAKKQIAALKKKLDDTVRRRSRGATAPKQRLVSDPSTQATYFLKNGKLFGPLSLRGRPNTNEFKFSVEKKVTYIDPISGGGMPIAVNGSNIRDLRKKLTVNGPGVRSIHLFLWEDSFSHLEPLRLAIEENGLRSSKNFCVAEHRVFVSDEPNQRYEE